MMQQHTIHIAGGVVRNPLVRLTEPVTLDFLAGEHIAIVRPKGRPGRCVAGNQRRRRDRADRAERSRKEPPGGYADGKVSFA